MTNGRGSFVKIRGSFCYRFQEKDFHHEETKNTKKEEERPVDPVSSLRVLRFFVVHFS